MYVPNFSFENQHGIFCPPRDEFKSIDTISELRTMRSSKRLNAIMKGIKD